MKKIGRFSVKSVTFPEVRHERRTGSYHARVWPLMWPGQWPRHSELHNSTSYDWHRRKAAASVFPSLGRLYAGLHLGRLIGCESRNTTARDALKEERATNDEDSKRGHRHDRETAVFRSKRAGIGERLSLCSLLGCCLFGPKLRHRSCRGRPCRRRIIGLRALFHAWHRRT